MDTEATRTIAQDVKGRVLSDILFGRLGPDDRLRLGPLCDAYEVGMSPLREALAQLVGRGFVIQDGQRGFRVAPVSRKELEDITATRIRLESMALRDAVAFGDDDWEAGILAAHHRLARRPRTADKLVDETWEQLHRRFHFALIEACRSPWLLSFIDTLYDQFDRYRRLAVRESGRHPKIANIHGELVDAVLAKNIARACSLLDSHIREVSTEVLVMGDARLFDLASGEPTIAGMPLARSATGSRAMIRGGRRRHRKRQSDRKGTER